MAQHSVKILEEALREFSPRLPPGKQPIHVTIAATLGEFGRRIGSFSQYRVAGVAKPAEGVIIVQSPRIRFAEEDYAGTLRHELLHVLIHRNTGKYALPRWLDEGLCMSYANEYYWQSGISVARMFLTGRVIPVGRLDRAFTMPGDEQEFSDAYAEGLSLVHFMRERLGDEVVWNAVLGTQHEDFESSLRHAAGIELTDLYADYYRSLWVVALVGVLTSGSLLGPASVLTIIAWWRIRRRNNRRLVEMAEDEKINPPPEAWYGDEEESEEVAEETPPR